MRKTQAKYTWVILDADVQYQNNPTSHLGDTASDGQKHKHIHISQDRFQDSASVRAEGE